MSSIDIPTAGIFSLICAHRSTLNFFFFLIVADSHLFSLARNIDYNYKCDDSRFWLSAHDCQVSSPNSQKLEVEHQIWFWNHKRIVSNASISELIHQQ
jgi:hypothetical protein